MSEIKKIIITTKQLAELFKVAEKYVSELVLLHGMPKVAHNQFNLVECLLWWTDYQKKLLLREIEKLKKDKPQDDLARNQSKLKEMEIKRQEGKLIDADLVEVAWRVNYKILSESLQSQGARIAPKIVGKTDTKEITLLIDEDNNKKLKEISELPVKRNA